MRGVARVGVAIALAALCGSAAAATVAGPSEPRAVTHAATLSGRAVTPSTQRELWQGAGVIVAHAGNFPPARAELLRGSGFRWVAVRLHHGLAREWANDRALAAGWVEGFRAAGLRVCGWGWVDAQPRREAALIAELVRRHDLDCYIADAEDPYLGGAYGGRIGRSALFVGEFRRRLPHLPSAVTTYGAAVAPWVLPFDYAPWRERNFALLPQAYLSIAHYLGPRSVVDHAVRAGYPRARVHPMIGIGWKQQRRAHSAADYAWRLRLAGARGFSVFLGERAADADFVHLGRGIRLHGLARPALPPLPPVPDPAAGGSGLSGAPSRQ